MENNQKKTIGKVAPKKGAAKDLNDLFEDSLQDIYWAEKALVKALPKMTKNATSKKLKTNLEGHLSETQTQVQRLEKVFEMIGKKAKAKKCDAMEGLLKEGEGIIEETQIGAVRDAGIIAACQKVEHYEIATYGTLISYANLLGHREASNVLSQTLHEEKNADEQLNTLALSEINMSAN